MNNQTERYCFSLSAKVTGGKAESFNLKGRPDRAIRPLRILTNVHIPGVVYVKRMVVLNQVILENIDMSYLIGPMFGMSSIGTIRPGEEISLECDYSGREVDGVKKPWWKFWQFWQSVVPRDYFVSFSIIGEVAYGEPAPLRFDDGI